MSSRRVKLKRKMKKWKEGPLPHITIVIIVITVSILIAYIVPFFQPITYVYNYGGSNYDRDGNIIYYYDLVEYTDRIYVHKDGDGSTGESWETAFSTINTAIAATSADLDDKTLIFAGLGNFDVDIAEQLDIDKNVHIVGSGRDSTIFSNSHASADFVFNVTRYFGIEHLTIFFNQSVNGINVYGNNSDVYFTNVGFNTENHTGTPTALRIDYGGHGEFIDVHFDGANTTSTAINISNSNFNHFNDIEIHEFNGTGIQISNNSNDNIFRFVSIIETNIGINIDGGISQHFHNIDLFKCTINIDDEVGNSYWHDIATEDMIARIIPNDLVGVTVNTAVGADTYGTDVLIFDASTIDTPYYIIALIFETSAGERYGLRAWYSFSSRYIYETIIEAKFANQIERLDATFPRLFNAHSLIYISVKSESGNDDMTVWLAIITI